MDVSHTQPPQRSAAAALRDTVSRLNAQVEQLLPSLEAPAPSRPLQLLGRADHAAFARKLLAERVARSCFFDQNFFADPAWDMLLDLYAASCESNTVAVSSLCNSAQVSSTTALRWVAVLEGAGLLKRSEDPKNNRSTTVSITDYAYESMRSYMVELFNKYRS